MEWDLLIQWLNELRIMVIPLSNCKADHFLVIRRCFKLHAGADGRLLFSPLHFEGVCGGHDYFVLMNFITEGRAWAVALSVQLVSVYHPRWIFGRRADCTAVVILQSRNLCQDLLDCIATGPFGKNTSSCGLRPDLLCGSLWFFRRYEAVTKFPRNCPQIPSNPTHVFREVWPECSACRFRSWRDLTIFNCQQTAVIPMLLPFVKCPFHWCNLLFPFLLMALIFSNWLFTAAIRTEMKYPTDTIPFH